MTAIIYWSGTGNTEMMAKAIEFGLIEAGEEVVLHSVGEVSDDIVEKYDKFAFGCPSMGDEILEEDEFEPFFISIESQLEGKKVALFGSYDWGDGEWMRDWSERTKAAGAQLLDGGLIQNLEPDEEECKAYGSKLANF
ncbi:MAG: flavodoxin [Tissierellia bacterium]|nr:flavodoxin [Tissierellia bacterium]